MKGNSEGTLLTEVQRIAQGDFVALAIAVDGSTAKAAQAIANCYKLGLHTAYKLSLTEYVVKTLSASNIAKSTVYYLRDIGNAYCVLGEERAELFPLDGLRHLASASKNDPKVLKAMALKAQGGRRDSKPSLKAVKECAKPSVAKTVDQLVGQLCGTAFNLGGQDWTVAIDLLTKAITKATTAQTIANKEPEPKVTKAKAFKGKNAGSMNTTDEFGEVIDDEDGSW
jgi:hypothetical protein